MTELLVPGAPAKAQRVNQRKKSKRQQAGKLFLLENKILNNAYTIGKADALKVWST